MAKNAKLFDAWSLVGVGGGSAALTWLAAGPKKTGTTLRLSLGGSDSLVTDVRFMGAALCWVASMYTKGQTKKTLQTAAAAAGFSLLQTEIIRMRLAKAKSYSFDSGTIFPTYGALPGPQHAGAQQQQQYAPQGQWAGR